MRYPEMKAWATQSLFPGPGTGPVCLKHLQDSVVSPVWLSSAGHWISVAMCGTCSQAACPGQYGITYYSIAGTQPLTADMTVQGSVYTGVGHKCDSLVSQMNKLAVKCPR